MTRYKVCHQAAQHLGLSQDLSQTSATPSWIFLKAIPENCRCQNSQSPCGRAKPNIHKHRKGGRRTCTCKHWQSFCQLYRQLYSSPCGSPSISPCSSFGGAVGEELSCRVPHLSIRAPASWQLQSHQVCDRALGISSGNQQTWRHHPSTGQGGAISDYAVVPQCAEVQ